MNKLEHFLINEMKYDPYEAEITVEDIQKLDEEGRKKVEELIDGKDVSGYAEGEYSVEKLINEKGFNVVAAVIAISNLKMDYEKYAELYKKPIK